VRDVIKIHPRDNVAVAIRSLKKGTLQMVDGKEISLVNDIAGGHKFSLQDIAEGEQIIKYSAPIGIAKQDIAAGEHIHTHNMKTGLEGVLEYNYTPQNQKISLPKVEKADFLGYRRDNGKVGIRNEIWIINTVGCVNKTAEILCREANKQVAGRHDGVQTFSHPYGCSQLGDDQLFTQKVLAGLVQHPNAGAVLVLGLGCENNHIAEFKKVLGPVDEKRVRFLVSQDVSDEIEAGLEIIEELSEVIKEDKREKCPVSELVVGMKCGGSDGFSGITANPLVGRITDLLVSLGGTSILTEVPEMFGAEQFLMNRAKDQQVFEKIVSLINDFKEYFQRHNQVIYENPSPGNKAGGISSLEEKSLGCIQKGGQSPISAVLGYTEPASVKGLNLMNGPGNDGVSVTNMIASGAHMVLFTTGRGNPLGGPAPTLKLASNNALAEKKPHWIDFNAGSLLEETDPDSLLLQLYDKILAVASGEQAKNEINGYREIAIFKDGVTL